jgi:tRNA 5-methylaminomethyl-2-thiouridine biosynthesis bifunctional protein
VGAGGSGNPAALVTPRLDAGLGEAARLFAQAFARATALYEQLPEAILARGVLQLAADARDAERFVRIAASDVFEPDAVTVLDAPVAAARLGEAAAPIALDQIGALVVEPAPILAAWVGEPRIAHVAALRREGGTWVLLDAAGDEILRADAVILTAALGSRDLIPDLRLQPVRGQASWTREAVSAPAAAWGGYVLPTRTGVLFGATHDRDESAVDLRDTDHARNRATLAAALPRLAARIAELPLEGRASIRAVTPDRLPIAGELGDGLFALTGFGSRGFSLAPLLAEHVAALALGAPSPVSRAAAELVAPDRFARRAARRRS